MKLTPAETLAKNLLVSIFGEKSAELLSEGLKIRCTFAVRQIQADALRAAATFVKEKHAEHWTNLTLAANYIEKEANQLHPLRESHPEQPLIAQKCPSEQS